ncbi:MAG: hypothetical protein H7A51_02565 [Akkermansiaceae bacterium]|nr:hypothetical protein [Akkermansiaceae bacterium]
MKKVFLTPLVSLIVPFSLIHAANDEARVPVTVTIKTPTLGWKLKIQSAHTRGDQLLLVCLANPPGGVGLTAIGKASDTIQLGKGLADRKRVVYLLGKTWNWDQEGVIGVTPKELQKHLEGSQPVYTAKDGKAAKPLKGNDDDFIGLSYEKAVELAKQRKLPCRVVLKDGRPLPATMDHRPDRLNFVLENNVVTKVRRG